MTTSMKGKLIKSDDQTNRSTNIIENIIQKSEQKFPKHVITKLTKYRMLKMDILTYGNDSPSTLCRINLGINIPKCNESDDN